jgi:tRNA(Arg) A34 adenosine deaminase TadA
MESDLRWLRHAIDLSWKSVEAGDYAFGTVIVGPDDRVLVQAVQTVAQTGNWLGHAEMNALQEAAARFTRADLKGATLYTSTEPCPMCTGAIGWSLDRLVFGLSQTEMYRLFPLAEAPPRFVEPWNCRTLLEHVHPPMEVIGPLLEEEAAEPHRAWIERWLKGESLGVA